LGISNSLNSWKENIGSRRKWRVNPLGRRGKEEKEEGKGGCLSWHHQDSIAGVGRSERESGKMGGEGENFGKKQTCGRIFSLLIRQRGDMPG